MGLTSLKSEVWIRKIERNWQDHGLRAVLRKGLAYLIKPLCERRTYRLYKIDLRQLTAEPGELEGISFRFLTVQDTAAIHEIESYSEWLRGTVRDRLQSNALCIGAFENGTIAGFNLVSFGDAYMPLVRMRRRFRHGEAWSEQIAVMRDCRRKGLGTHLRLRIFRELARRGFRKLYGGALVDNVPSLEFAQRVGFREFVDIGYSRLLFWSSRKYQRVKK